MRLLAGLMLLLFALWSGAWPGVWSGIGHAGMRPDQQAAGELEAALQACRKISSNIRRLRCYDQIKTTEGAEGDEGQKPAAIETRVITAPTVTPVEINQAQKSSVARLDGRSWFGLKPPKNDMDIPRQITARVVEIRRPPDKPALFILDDRSIWQRTDGAQATSLQAPFDVTIKKGLLFSYYLTGDAVKDSIKVKRLE